MKNLFQAAYDADRDITVQLKHGLIISSIKCSQKNIFIIFTITYKVIEVQIVNDGYAIYSAVNIGKLNIINDKYCRLKPDYIESITPWPRKYKKYKNILHF